MPRSLSLSVRIAACTWLVFSAAQQNEVLEGISANTLEQVCIGSSSDSCTHARDEEAAHVALLQEKLEMSSSKANLDSEAEDTWLFGRKSDPSKTSKVRKLPKGTRFARLLEMVAGALVVEASPARVDPLMIAGSSGSKESELQKPLPKTMVDSTLWFSYICCAIYSVWACKDILKIVKSKTGTSSAAKLLQKPSEDSIQPSSKATPESTTATPGRQEEQHWSILGIWGLCFYRVYTGFLAATWLPYVLAMEGGVLWPQNQSLFMGSCKMIYGVTVLMNPLCGLINDKMAESSLGAARRLWIHIGIVMSAAGILICLFAGPAGWLWTYLFGITLWRVGETLNDVTVEAIVPEMVPKSQFEVASAVKAASFLVGGLAGYYMVYCFAHVHYYWCYYAYLICMFVTAVPSLLLLNDDMRLAPTSRESASLLRQLAACYTTPMSAGGGFPASCLAIFVLGCSCTPFFFGLLMLRDLVGMGNVVDLQHAFSISCLTFFIAAALSAVLDIAKGGRAGPNNRQGQTTDLAKWEQTKREKLDTLINVSWMFVLVVGVMPLVSFLPPGRDRMAYWYANNIAFGALYGFSFSRVQDLVWRLLPADVAMANAMGFIVMCRNFGVGVGNFLGGFVLDQFQLPGTPPTDSLTDVSHAADHQLYSWSGYVTLCGISAAFAVLAVYLSIDIRDRHVKGV